MKFNNDLTLHWSTRYGGNSVDVARQIIRDPSGRIWVTGDTQSSNFPTSSSSDLAEADHTLGGNIDDFLIRLSGNGIVEWSSYIGGSGSEYNAPKGVTKLAIAPNSKIFFCGTTTSADLPAVFNSASWDDNNIGGQEDGYLVQFNYNEMTALWATYMGGSAQDFATGCFANSDNGVFVAGQAGNNDLTALAPGDLVYKQQATLPGFGSNFKDGFVAHYTPQMVLDWFTYWGGTSFHQGERINDLYAGNNLLYLVGSVDQQYLFQFDETDVRIPLVDFDLSSDLDYFDETYNGQYEDAFICMFDIKLVTSVEQAYFPENHSTLQVFPVPAIDQLIVMSGGNGIEPTHLNITDMEGRLLQCIKWNRGQLAQEIRITDFGKGCYIVSSFSNELQLSTTKFIKQ